MRWSVVAVVVVLMAVPAAKAQERQTENTWKLAPGATSPPATIADMAWLAGSWAGEAFGGAADEVWSAPAGGAMMGMYRLVKDGAPVFYELLTIVEEEGSLVLRLKHFHADLRGWEEKDETVDFPLVKKDPDGAVHFAGMSFHRDGDDGLVVHLALGDHGGGELREETFRYRRMASVSAGGKGLADGREED